MAIQSIDDAFINNSRQAFGGYVYNVQYNPTFSDSPSSMTIHFISEDGTYNKPVLSVKQPYSIRLGTGINLNMYAVESNLEKSAGGRTLQVKFVDGSIILDKKYVGLYKRHGLTGSSGCMIIVGQEFHPCDANMDGVIDITDQEYVSDPCNLSGTYSGITVTGENGEEITTFPPRPPTINLDYCSGLSKTRILEVGYNFNQLISGIKAAGIKVANIPKTNDWFFNQYTGPLRSTLRDWCADYGLQFFWENDELNFIDMKQEIKINPVLDESRLVSYSEKESLEGTVSRGVISYYSQDGDDGMSDCRSIGSMSLNPVGLRDLGQPQKEMYGSEMTNEDFAALCMLGKFNTNLRDSFILYDQSKLNLSSDNAFNNINDKKAYLKAVGINSIKKVIKKTDPLYNKVLTEMTKTVSKQIITDMTSGGAIVIAEYDPHFHNSIKEKETKFANEFMGKFYVGYGRPRLCNINQPNPIVTEGRVEFYEADNKIESLPYHKFLSSSGKQALLGDRYNKSGQNNVLNANLTILERSTNWMPNEGQHGDWMEYSYEAASRYNMHKLGSDGQGLAPSLQNIVDKYSDPTIKSDANQALGDLQKPYVTAFAIPYATMNMEYSELKNNDNEPDITNYNVDNVVTTYGLKDKRSFAIQEKGQWGIYIASPAQMMEKTDGYKMLYNNNAALPIRKEKIQTILQTDIDKCNENTMAFDITYKTVDINDIKLLGGNVCQTTEDTLKEIHEKVNKNMSFSVTTPRIEKTYEVVGVNFPSNTIASIKNGLVGLTISLRDNGAFSSYTFSNRPPIMPSMNLTLKTIYREKRNLL